MTVIKWRTKLSPADCANLMQGLCRGADLSTDFLVMLGLAAAIASLGLIQDSPAVVIGSMLLAPLMAPRIACVLVIAKANKKLGRQSMVATAVGFLLTVAISVVVGRLTPGNELAQQIIARGSPTILDLLVALFSAVAAAYAFARPSICFLDAWQENNDWCRALYCQLSPLRRDCSTRLPGNRMLVSISLIHLINRARAAPY